MTQIVRIETKYQGRGRYSLATFRLAGERTLTREIEDHGRAVSVLAYDPERRKALLVRQFRGPVFLAAKQEETLEAIAGIVEEADPAATARREALEEAGLKLGNLELVATVWTMPGFSTERADLYLAPYGPSDLGGERLDEDAAITVVELPLSELARMADEGSISDVKTLALAQTLRLRRPELFLP